MTPVLTPGTKKARSHNLDGINLFKLDLFKYESEFCRMAGTMSSILTGKKYQGDTITFDQLLATDSMSAI